MSTHFSIATQPLPRDDVLEAFTSVFEGLDQFTDRHRSFFAVMSDTSYDSGIDCVLSSLAEVAKKLPLDSEGGWIWVLVAILSDEGDTVLVRLRRNHMGNATGAERHIREMVVGYDESIRRKDPTPEETARAERIEADRRCMLFGHQPKPSDNAVTVCTCACGKRRYAKGGDIWVRVQPETA